MYAVIQPVHEGIWTLVVDEWMVVAVAIVDYFDCCDFDFDCFVGGED